MKKQIKKKRAAKKKVADEKWKRIRNLKAAKVVAALIMRMPDFGKCGGLIPVIIQEKGTKRVLMLAYTRVKEFWETFYTHEVVLWSRSRKKRWKKGEEKSGNILKVVEMYLDCDGDTLLYIVQQTKPEVGVCHTGAQTCFSPIITSVFEQKGNTTLKIIPL